jgi:predicted acylesterase/phospholipase RssA
MTGLFSTSGIEKYMREEVLPSNRFHDFLPELFIVATQLNHSRKVVFGKKCFEPPKDDLTCQYEDSVPVSDACAASTALPVIFSPYAIKKEEQHPIHYVDGEIRDTLSTHVAADAGADLIFASYTHQPYHLNQETGSLTQHGIASIVIQSIYLLIEQKIKNQIHNRQAHRSAIDAVSKFCKTEGISDRQRQQICRILEGELNARSNVDYIYIHPRPTDAELFFGEHFSFSPKKMVEIVKSGFRATIDTLRKYEFSDRPKRHAIGTTRSGAEEV